MPTSQFKVCQRCGTICETKISHCPNLTRGSLDLCHSADFRPVSLEGLKEMGNNGLVRAYFLSWPQGKEAWHAVTSKIDMEEFSK